MSQKSAVVYSQTNCQACNTTKTVLRLHGYTVEERILGINATKEQLWADFPGARNVPQIMLNDVAIGTLQDLNKFLADE